MNTSRTAVASIVKLLIFISSVNTTILPDKIIASSFADGTQAQFHVVGSPQLPLCTEVMVFALLILKENNKTIKRTLPPKSPKWGTLGIMPPFKNDAPSFNMLLIIFIIIDFSLTYTQQPDFLFG